VLAGLSLSLGIVAMVKSFHLSTFHSINEGEKAIIDLMGFRQAHLLC